MSRAVIQESFGGSDTLQVREVAEPHAGPGRVRVRVAAAGLNPVDWKIAASPEVAAVFGVSLPSGFGNDLAGTIDEVGDGVEGFAVGDRVFGGARGHAIADHVVIDVASEILHHTPAGVDDEVAATLAVAGRTAEAALDAAAVAEGSTVLVGGAAGGVGVIVVPLAVRRGARVIGTGSAESADFIRSLGAEPVTYGDGLVDRVRALAPDGVDAAIDLPGRDAALAALELGVPGDRIATIAAHPPVEGTVATGGTAAQGDALDRIAALIAEGGLTVPIAAAFPIENIRSAVDLQRAGHVKGKVVVTL